MVDVVAVEQGFACVLLHCISILSLKNNRIMLRMLWFYSCASLLCVLIRICINLWKSLLCWKFHARKNAIKAVSSSVFDAGLNKGRTPYFRFRAPYSGNFWVLSFRFSQHKKNADPWAMTGRCSLLRYKLNEINPCIRYSSRFGSENDDSRNVAPCTHRQLTLWWSSSVSSKDSTDR